MWSKSFRYTLFTGIYQHLFWKNEFGLDQLDVDWSVITAISQEVLTQNEQVQAIQIFDTYLENREVYESILKPLLNSWDKTFDIVKAALFTGVLELIDIQNEPQEILEKSVGKYIHLTQDMIGGKNPALVHAVLSKVLEENLYKTSK
jgi:transcription termination factor NusB